MELGLVHQILGQARAADGGFLYEVLTCGVEPGEVRTDADFAVRVDHGLDLLADADTVIVPASHEGDEAVGIEMEPLVRAVAKVDGVRIASICTGAFVLAAAGLLDGLRATTHWQSAGLLAARYPLIEVDADVLYVDEGRVLTSAGEASGIDLCLHIVREDFGAAVANDVARRTVVAPHREGGQAQFVKRVVPVPESWATTGESRSWAISHLGEAITLRQLAERSAMSVRTFTRRFREEVGMSPMEWVTQQRVDRARQLLEETDFGVDHVAVSAGFGTAAALRAHFTKSLGVSPSAYRRMFRPRPTAP